MVAFKSGASSEDSVPDHALMPFLEVSCPVSGSGASVLINQKPSVIWNRYMESFLPSAELTHPLSSVIRNRLFEADSQVVAMVDRPTILSCVQSVPTLETAMSFPEAEQRKKSSKNPVSEAPDKNLVLIAL
jgi:hypothetical protein